MKFTAGYVISMLLLALAALMLGLGIATIPVAILAALLLFVVLVLEFLAHEYTMTRTYLNLLVFLTLCYLVTVLIGEPSWTTLVLGIMFVIGYLFMVAFVLLDRSKPRQQYRVVLLRK